MTNLSDREQLKDQKLRKDHKGWCNRHQRIHSRGAIYPSCRYPNSEYNLKFKVSLEKIKEEDWRDIKGYENLYKIAQDGRIVGLHENAKCKLLKPSHHASGYLKITLSKNHVQRTFQLHRLIAQAFIPNTKHKREINHKNGVKTDNRLENLEWATTQENHLHAFRTGLQKPTWLGKLGKDCPASKPVCQYDLSGNIIAVFAGAAEAQRKTGIDQGSIRNVCHGKRKLAGGFVWKNHEKN